MVHAVAHAHPTCLRGGGREEGNICKALAQVLAAAGQKAECVPA